MSRFSKFPDEDVPRTPPPYGDHNYTPPPVPALGPPHYKICSYGLVHSVLNRIVCASIYVIKFEGFITCVSFPMQGEAGVSGSPGPSVRDKQVVIF